MSHPTAFDTQQKTALAGANHDCDQHDASTGTVGDLPQPASGQAPVKRVVGRPVQKGQVLNPKGRPKGSKNKRTLLGDQLEARGVELAAAVLQKALDGDTMAMGLVLARAQPPLRATYAPVEFDLDRSLTLTEQAGQIIEAISKGQISVDQGKMLLDALGTYASLKQVDELAAEILAIKQRLEVAV